MSDFWDPDPFVVGDRVRVRLSGECRYQDDPNSWFLHFTHWAQGLQGEVVEVDPNIRNGHGCRVVIEHECQSLGVTKHAGWLARAELQRLPRENAEASQ